MCGKKMGHFILEFPTDWIFRLETHPTIQHVDSPLSFLRMKSEFHSESEDLIGHPFDKTTGVVIFFHQEHWLSLFS